MKGGRTAPRNARTLADAQGAAAASMKGGRTAPRNASLCWAQLAWGKLADCEWVGIFV